MRVGRSLSPGKVLFERDGVLKKITTDEMSGNKFKKTGYYRIPRTGVPDMLFQWGISNSLAVVDVITFPIPFSTPPVVTSQAQTGSVEITNITTTGFQLRTLVDSVPWVAYGVE